jgi:hypothetical protein
MHEEDIRNHHRHDTLIRRRSQASNSSCSKETGISGHSCLPDIGSNTDETTDRDSWTSPEDVREGHDDEVGVAECHCCCSEEHVYLWNSFVELLDENWGQGCDGERCEDLPRCECWLLLIKSGN